MHWIATVWPIAYFTGDWSAVPDAILWVDVSREVGGKRRTMQLRGADWYWVDGERFGVYFDPHPQRPAAQDRAWVWPEGADPSEIAVPPREAVPVRAGIEIPDAEWEHLISGGIRVG